MLLELVTNVIFFNIDLLLLLLLIIYSEIFLLLYVCVDPYILMFIVIRVLWDFHLSPIFIQVFLRSLNLFKFIYIIIYLHNNLIN